MAEFGRRLFYQFGVGLGFIGTVRKDGGPRLHPMCPLLFDGNLYAFIERGPKYHDLRRDPRYALHAFPAARDDHEFFITGRAELVATADPRQHAAWRVFRQERGQPVAPGDVSMNTLFELFLDRALMVVSPGHGNPKEQERVWRSNNSAG